MKTIVVDTHLREEINEQIAAKEPKRGDSLKFIVENSEVATVLILLGIVAYMLYKRKESNDFAARVLNDLFQNKSLEELEREIEQEYDLEIEINKKVEDKEPNYQFFPGVEYAPRADDQYIKELQEQAKETWVGKVDTDEWLNELRGRA